MNPLSRKLLRDLRRLLGQVVTIALVVACGIASFVTLRSTYDSLLVSRDAYYEAYRFADVFARLERAPESVRERAETIPGVAALHTRVVESAMVPMPSMPRPATAIVVSLPPDSNPALNAVYIKQGRGLDPDRADEVIVLEGFAEAHGLAPGDELPAVAKNIGYELRCADPVPFDMEYTRDLGYCAAKFILNGGTDCLISMQGGQFVPIPYDSIMDPETGRMRVRLVDMHSTAYAIARRYMIRLRRDDFADPHALAKYAATCGLHLEEFEAQFKYLIDTEPPPLGPDLRPILDEK